MDLEIGHLDLNMDYVVKWIMNLNWVGYGVKYGIGLFKMDWALMNWIIGL